MTTSPDDFLTLDASNLPRSVTNAFRTAFIIGGGSGVILGAVMLLWPVKTFAVFAVAVGIFFLVTAIIRVTLGIFSRGISGGHRLLNILLGLLLGIVGLIAVKDPAATAATLLVFVVIAVGVGWIIDGIVTIVESKNAASPGWAIAYGIIGIIAGITVLAVPGWSVVWLVIFASIALIVLGIAAVVRGITFGRGTAQSREEISRFAPESA